MTFAHRAALITGASSGIGWALAKLLAAEGCKVGLLARRKGQLDALAAEILAAGGVAAACPADISDRSQVLNAAHEIAEQLGPFDLLIANAGISRPTLLEPINASDIEEMVRVNLLGVIYAVEAVLPAMLQRGSGHLAAISSLAAYKGLPGHSAYCATKAAVNSYLEGLRIELRDRGIAVTTICPGFIRTPMTDVNEFRMPFLLEPEDAARRIHRALRRRRKVYDFPWQTALLMKLTMFAPDWLMARSIPRQVQTQPLPPPQTK